jgi:hypothetical protein
MNTEIEYGFWFWSDKLIGILTMLSKLAGYQLDKEEIDIIHQELRGTNDDKNLWLTYHFEGKLNIMKLYMAYVAEQSTDMIFIKISTSADLKPKLQALDLFQSIFKQLEVEEL